MDNLFVGYIPKFSFDRMMYGLQVPDSDNFAPVDNWNIPLGASTTDFHANADSNLNVCWQPDPSQTVAHLCKCTLDINNENACVTTSTSKDILNQGPCASTLIMIRWYKFETFCSPPGKTWTVFSINVKLTRHFTLYLSSRTARRL